jgi:hypothetical protein
MSACVALISAFVAVFALKSKPTYLGHNSGSRLKPIEG